MTSSDTGRVGRKRSQTSRQAILSATLELVIESGYGALTVEGIAARSGAGKQTIYRWWPSKADVLLEALSTTAELHIPIPDEGSFAADLHAFLTASVRLGQRAPVGQGLRALMAEAQINPEFGERFQRQFLQRRRDALGEILTRAQIRGDMPTHVTADFVCDVVFGVIWYRLLSTPRPITRGLADDLLSLFTARLTPPTDHGEAK
jgi:AcrR family transcriptional regulator